MTQEKQNMLRKASAWVCAVLILLTAAALMVSCLQIYNLGDRPFSREVIGQYFDRISVLVCLCLAAIVVGIGLHVALPGEKVRPAVLRDEKETLRRLALTKGVSAEIIQERRKLTGYKLIVAVIMVLSAIWPAVHYLNIANFGITDITGDVIRAVIPTATATAVSMGALYVYALAENRSYRRQLAIYKDLPKTESQSVPVRGRSHSLIRIGILAAALLLIALGIFNDGISDVLGKAIRICTECIGLG